MVSLIMMKKLRDLEGIQSDTVTWGLIIFLSLVQLIRYTR